MANREVNLTKRVQTPHGWRYCRVLLSANGRVKPDVVFVNGKEERHQEGAYYLEWRDGSKRVRLSVGKDPADASARRLGWVKESRRFYGSNRLEPYSPAFGCYNSSASADNEESPESLGSDAFSQSTSQRYCES
jgi:hypothetical protein